MKIVGTLLVALPFLVMIAITTHLMGPFETFVAVVFAVTMTASIAVGLYLLYEKQ